MSVPEGKDGHPATLRGCLQRTFEASPHHCVTTMKSVSFLVSWLIPWSDITSEEAGVSNSEIRSTTSCGISMRSRAVLALSGNGTGRVDSIICFAGASRSLAESLDIRGNSSGIDTTVQ